MMKRYIKIPSLLIFLTLFALVQCKEPASLSALIISDNSPGAAEMLKTIMENTSLFDVDINDDAKPEFSDYDVIVLNLEKAGWDDETKQEFESYINAGGGAVLMGATINAFENWAGSSKVFGTETGVQLKKSNKAYDYLVANSDVEHPITNGLQKRWLHGGDYLLYNTANLSDNVEVLATVRADSVYGGDNSSIPVMYSLSTGEGRVFGSTLGYGPSIDHYEAILCVGFITTLQRGAEWAATGVVSQEVPIDFPNSASTHLWESLRPLTLEEILDKAATYQVGKSKKYLSDFSIRIRNSDGKPETYAMYESQILEFLDSDASVDSKKYMCRELSWMGSETSIPVLEKLVNDKELSESASYALQRLKM